jgi:hypothetical protein
VERLFVWYLYDKDVSYRYDVSELTIDRKGVIKANKSKGGEDV